MEPALRDGARGRLPRAGRADARPRDERVRLVDRGQRRTTLDAAVSTCPCLLDAARRRPRSGSARRAAPTSRDAPAPPGRDRRRPRSRGRRRRPGDQAVAMPGRTPARRSAPPAAATVAADGYCEHVRHAARPGPRDHFVEQPAPWVAAVCDRGLRHPRNEDAVAVAADPAGRPRRAGRLRRGLVARPTPTWPAWPAPAPRATCSPASHAARAWARLGAGSAAGRRRRCVDGDRRGQRRRARRHGRGRRRARRRARSWPPSWTARRLVVGWVGDSRAYWLPGRRRRRALLTVDDSLAAEQIARGVPRRRGRERPAGARHHPLARAGRPRPHAAARPPCGSTAPGWVLVCSDGLWNYCSEAADLAALVRQTAQRDRRRAPPAGRGAGRLGQRRRAASDNITVALARVDAPA